MKRRVVSMALTAVLFLGLGVPALAVGPTFNDVPSTYWGYADIEAVAEAGLMNGTGNGAFSPEMKVSVAQFLTLLGRLVFPDVKTEGADWYGPYVTAAQTNGLLMGTLVDVNNVEAEITRYDMAVILRAAAKQLGIKENTAESNEVSDYLDIPTRYADAVLAVYGMGLIRGDQAGNFNGSNTMMRAEVATVIMRLKKAPEKQAKEEEEAKIQAEKEAQEWYESSRTGEYVTFTIHGGISAFPSGRLPGAPVSIYYKDGRLLGETVADENSHFQLELTVDKADFNTKDEVYYAALTDWYEFEGMHYNTTDLSRRPIYKLGEPSVSGYVLGCRAYSYETFPDRFPNVDPSIFE